MVKQKRTKLLAGFLAFVMIVGMLPMSVFSSAFASGIESYTVRLTDGTDVLELDDVEVTLTCTADESTSTALTKKGIATFSEFVEEDALYTLAVSEVIGYEKVAPSVISVASGDTSTDVTMTAIETVSVSGKVTDENGEAYKGATVKVSGYNTLETETNDEGVYTFDAYKGKTISIEITAKEEKYVVINSQATYNSETTDADYQFMVKTFDIRTSGSGESGTISDGENGVPYGDNRQIEIQAKDGYRIEKVTVNSAEVAEAANQKAYTLELSDIKDNYDITVSFYRMTYKITFTVGSDGEVTYGDGDTNKVAGGSVSIEKNFEESTDPSKPTTVTVTATPNTNYRVKTVTIDGQVTSFSENDYVYVTSEHNADLVMTKDHTFEVEFSINQYKLEVSTNDHGSASWDKEKPVTETTADYGTGATLTITPEDGYAVSDATVNGNPATVTEDEDGIYITISDITEDKSVVITFAKLEENAPSEKLTNEYYNISFSKEQVKDAYYDGDTYVVVLPKDATATIAPVSPYSGIKYNTNKANGGYSNSIEISETTTISNIYVRTGALWGDKENVSVNVKIIIDKVSPVLADIAEQPWTNNDTVAVSGTATDAEASSGLNYIVWNKDAALSTEEVLATTENKVSIVNGSYSFTSKEGEQDSTYYVYAVDYAGNVSAAKTVQVRIDKKLPKIIGFTFSTEQNSVIENLINFATFGTVCKQTMYVTVSANDEDITSGFNQISLYYGNKLLETKDAPNGTATFELTEEKFHELTEIHAVVTDVAGNESVPTKPTDSGVTTQAQSNNVQIATDKPTATITADKEVYLDGNNRWYNGNVSFTVNVKDEITGIKSVVITMNDTELDVDMNDVKLGLDQDYSSDGKVTEKTFVVNTSQEPLEGKNTIKVKVINNADVESIEYTEDVYIDTEEADIIGYEFTSINNEPLKKVLNFLTFGIFFNEQVKITVTAEDKDPASGVKEIALYLGDEELTQTVDSDNKAVFTVTAAELAENSVFSADISAKATDNVGNTTAKAVLPTTVNSDIESTTLMLENVAPTLDVTFDAAASNKNEATKDSNDWYARDVKFKVTSGDADSGIRNVTITINEDELINENYNDKIEVTKAVTHEVTTADATIKADGSYAIKVSVTDNAGNVNDTYSKTIYKDTTPPEISGFKFQSANYVEGDGEEVSVEVTEYGFYFKEDTKVTISATDEAPTSGIKSITYYTVDFTNDAAGMKSSEQNLLVNSENSITITIPANFKGQIYAKATDNVDNTANEFVNPNSAIVESEEKHNEESHIAFDKAKTNYTANDDTELYANDVDVTVTVSDTYSGIREIEWSVVAPYDKANNQSGKVTLNNDKTVVEGTETDWVQTKSEVNLVTEMQKTITVNNNSNNIIVKVKMTDRAGNTSEKEIEFSIDKTSPIIEITYGNNEVHDAQYTDFFSTKRTATITITERNFRASDVEFAFINTDKIIPAINLKAADSWKTTVNSEDPDKTVHVAVVEYAADGDYTFDISYKDNAENAANKIKQHKFTIDMTKPTVMVVYDNNSALNGNYYKADRIATITIKEHNFDAARVNVIGVATDNGAASVFPTTSAWRDNGDDTHTAIIAYTADSKYTFDIEFHDKANNSIDDYAAEEFYVDKTAPNLEITGVADKSANNGTVAPVVRYYDTNFDVNNVTITLSGINNGVVKYSGSYADIENGQTYTYADFERVQKVDDIYTLTATLTDLAGNETTQTISFSTNRFGSVYDLKAVENILNKYLSVEQDIVFTETNVDSLDREGILIKLTKNGTPTDLVEGTDYTVEVSGGNGQWSVYTYTIKKALFTDDGRYSISIYSTDAAGNVNENIDESKAAEISFGIDKTNPVIVPIDLESGTPNRPKEYVVELKNVEVEIKDNLVLEEVKIFLNDEEVEYTVDGETYTFAIPESNNTQDVKVVATDAAGNEAEVKVENFLVSTNIWARWRNNTPFFVSSIIGVVVITIGLIAFILFGKKKKKEDK